MKRWRVLHKPTGALAEVSANEFWQACLYLGYTTGECIGVRLSDRTLTRIKHYQPGRQLDLGEQIND